MNEWCLPNKYNWKTDQLHSTMEFLAAWTTGMSSGTLWKRSNEHPNRGPSVFTENIFIKRLITVQTPADSCLPRCGEKDHRQDHGTNYRHAGSPALWTCETGSGCFSPRHTRSSSFICCLTHRPCYMHTHTRKLANERTSERVLRRKQFHIAQKTHTRNATWFTHALWCFLLK